AGERTGCTTAIRRDGIETREPGTCDAGIPEDGASEKRSGLPSVHIPTGRNAADGGWSVESTSTVCAAGRCAGASHTSTRWLDRVCWLSLRSFRQRDHRLA